ncbi:hypothetical protein ERJ75_000105900 [Trypanosoma vivax]|nr:hypothetical protein ERJ75_000105900 [Trypanosoma vivax]
MRTRRTPQQRGSGRRCHPRARAVRPRGERARARKGRKDTRRCRLSKVQNLLSGRGTRRRQKPTRRPGRRREVRAQGRLGRAGRAAARGGGGRKRAGPGPRSERYPEVAGRQHGGTRAGCGCGAAGDGCSPMKGEEAREQLLHATAAANAALAVVDEAQRQRPRQWRRRGAGGNGSNGAGAAVALAGRCRPAAARPDPRSAPVRCRGVVTRFAACCRAFRPPLRPPHPHPRQTRVHAYACACAF